MSDTGNVDLKTANEEVDEIDAAFCESVGIGAHGSEIHRALLKQEPLTEKQKSEFWTLYEPRLNGGSEDYSRYQASVWHFLDPDLSDPDFQETYQNVCDEMVTRYRKGIEHLSGSTVNRGTIQNTVPQSAALHIPNDTEYSLACDCTDRASPTVDQSSAGASTTSVHTNEICKPQGSDKSTKTMARCFVRSKMRHFFAEQSVPANIFEEIMSSEPVPSEPFPGTGAFLMIVKPKAFRDFMMDLSVKEPQLSSKVVSDHYLAWMNSVEGYADAHREFLRKSDARREPDVAASSTENHVSLI